MGGGVGQGEVILWCSVYEVYKHAVTTNFKILHAETQLSIPFMCCFLYLTYVYKGLFVQLSKYQYKTTTGICYKASWPQADTCTITLKKTL